MVGLIYSVYFRYLGKGEACSWLHLDGRRVYPTETSVTPEELVRTLKTILFGRQNCNLVVLFRGYVDGRYVLSLTSTRLEPAHAAHFDTPPEWFVNAMMGVVPRPDTDVVAVSDGH